MNRFLPNAFLTLLVIGACASFFYKRGERQPELRVPDNLALFALDDTPTTWADLVAHQENMYIVILSITDCEPCIYEGMNRLAHETAKGETAIAVVIDDWAEEVKGWAYHYPDIPVYRVTQAQFNRLQAPGSPLWLEITRGTITTHEVITISKS
ncbi:MAG: hypothetical protein QNK37_32730 [Acidobacteriota bacterium]|nr:hypothetical protein [Acidobacteriota bacterium]